MALKTMDEGRETSSFKIADEKIENLLKRLHDKNVCPCCTARALAFHAAALAEDTMGSAAAIARFEEVITALRVRSSGHRTT